MWVALIVLATAASCKDASDCSLNGDCVANACRCDPGWTTIAPGPECSHLDFAVTEVASPGYHNETWNTWGGRPVYWKEDKKWHLFVTELAGQCNVDAWINNSFITHSTSDSPGGPWSAVDVTVPVFSSNAQAVLHPDGTWLVYYIGGQTLPADDWVQCGEKTINWPPVATGGVPQSDQLLKIASSKSPFGPWTMHDINIPNLNSSKVFDCDMSNPAPYVDEDGVVTLGFNGGGCHGGLETLGVMQAKTWNGDYTLLTMEPIGLPTGCPTGQFAEDPTLWRSERGWHIIAHGLCDWHPPASDLFSLYAYSTDLKNWTVSRNQDNSTGLVSLPSPVYSKTVQWSNSTSQYISRVERPQVVFDADHKVIGLTNAVCPGGNSVGSCRTGNPSWTLYRPLNL